MSFVEAAHSRSTTRFARDGGSVNRSFPPDAAAILPGLGYDSRESWTNAADTPLFVGAVTGVLGAGGAVGTGHRWESAGGLVREVVAVTTLNGLPAVTLRLSGTNTGPSTVYPDYYFHRYGQGPAASAGQTWTASALIRIDDDTDVSGFASYPARLAIAETRSDGSFLVNSHTSAVTQDVVHTRTLTDAATAKLRQYLSLPVVSGGSVDITMTIAAPQLVQLGYQMPFSSGATDADSLILTSADLGFATSVDYTLAWRGRVFPGGAVVWPDIINLSSATQQGCRVELDSQASKLRIFHKTVDQTGLQGLDRADVVFGEIVSVLATVRSDGTSRVKIGNNVAINASGLVAHSEPLDRLSVGCDRFGQHQANCITGQIGLASSTLTDGDFDQLFARVST